MSKKDAWMTTFTGKKFYPLDPVIDDICIEDIAHHLAMECRYCGACRFHYSVAQHCVLGAELANSEDKLAFLLHDGAEAYFKDMVRNVKVHLGVYKDAEAALQEVVYQRFGIVDLDRSEIKRLDYAIMATEVNVLMSNKEGWHFPEPPLNVPIHPWQWQYAEVAFLDAYAKYSKYSS